jgi:hypothetical protein
MNRLGTQNGYNSSNSAPPKELWFPRLHAFLYIYLVSSSCIQPYSSTFPYLLPFSRVQFTSKTTGRFKSCSWSEPRLALQRVSWWWRQIFHACDSETMWRYDQLMDGWSEIHLFVDGGRSVGISTMVGLIRLSCSSDPVDLVAQAALPSSNGYWIQSQCWTCSPSPCWNESWAQGLHWQSQWWYLFHSTNFATISSLKELNLSDCRFLQPKGSTGLIPSLAAKLEMINLKLCSMSDAQVVDLV